MGFEKACSYKSSFIVVWMVKKTSWHLGGTNSQVIKTKEKFTNSSHVIKANTCKKQHLTHNIYNIFLARKCLWQYSYWGNIMMYNVTKYNSFCFSCSPVHHFLLDGWELIWYLYIHYLASTTFECNWVVACWLLYFYKYAPCSPIIKLCFVLNGWVLIHHHKRYYGFCPLISKSILNGCLYSKLVYWILK
jgi:hypothetical protein